MPLRARIPRRSSCMILPGSASRKSSYSVACMSASSWSVASASVGWKGSAKYDVTRLSRPKAVMNHGSPPAGIACPTPLVAGAVGRVREPLRQRDRQLRLRLAEGVAAQERGPLAPVHDRHDVDAGLPLLVRAEVEVEDGAALLELHVAAAERDDRLAPVAVPLVPERRAGAVELLAGLAVAALALLRLEDV